MNPNDLIDSLSKELKPVKVKSFNLLSFTKILFVFTLSLLFGLSISGIRSDFLTVINNPRFIIESLVLLILALSSSSLAFLISLPGRSYKFLIYTSSITALIWSLFLIYFLVRIDHPAAGYGFSCIRDISFMTLLPAIYMFYFVRSAVVFNPYKIGFIVLLGAVSFGAFATQLTCKNDNPLHIIVWHFLPMLIILIIGIVLGKILLKKL